MLKKVSSRGIIIENDYIYTMFRHKKNYDGTIKEYYVIPGGKVESNETLEETLLREIKEELSVDINILEYLGKNEDENSIAHFYKCFIKEGTPKLGGEELEKCCEDNYYEIRKVKLSDIENINIFPKDLIIKVVNSIKESN